jgi:predicted anti-sigma-YlaC factor YlaD
MDRNLKCEYNETFSERMSLALDGLLDAKEEQALHQHLAGCSTCQAEWQAMQQISALFRRSEMVGPPLGFALRVERRLAEQARKRKRTFGSIAMLTGSLSLAGVTIAAITVVALGLMAWLGLGSQPAVQQGTSALSQIASGLGLMGKGASLFLLDLLLRYGPPLLLLVGIGLTFLAGAWAWLFVKRPGKSRHNGYA